MTKTDLVEFVRAQTELKSSEAAAAVKAVLEGISSALAAGDKVQLVGFGTFEVRERSARTGRNPQDPTKTVEIPAKNVPVFKAGKGLRTTVDSASKKVAKKGKKK